MKFYVIENVCRREQDEFNRFLVLDAEALKGRYAELEWDTAHDPKDLEAVLSGELEVMSAYAVDGELLLVVGRTQQIVALAYVDAVMGLGTTKEMDWLDPLLP